MDISWNKRCNGTLTQGIVYKVHFILSIYTEVIQSILNIQARGSYIIFNTKFIGM